MAGERACGRATRLELCSRERAACSFQNLSCDFSPEDAALGSLRFQKHRIECVSLNELCQERLAKNVALPHTSDATYFHKHTHMRNWVGFKRFRACLFLYQFLLKDRVFLFVCHSCPLTAWVTHLALQNERLCVAHLV